MFLSIILPVYNVEKKKKKCIRSIECQDIEKNEYELIAVDDGSTDNSMHIVKVLASEFDNLRFIQQNNKGASAARNLGLKYAKGKYVWFIDSDDYIEKNVLKNLIFKIKTNNLDLLSFNIFDINDDKEVSGFNIKKQPKDIIINGEEYIKHYEIVRSVWCFIVKKDILIKNNLFFKEGIIHEDYEYPLKLYRFIGKMSFDSTRVYNYVHHKGSVSSTKTHSQILKSIHSWQSIISDELAYFKDDSTYSKYARFWINNHKFYGISILFFNKLTLAEKKKEFDVFKKIGAFNIGRTKLGNKKLILICKILRNDRLYYFFMHIFRCKKQ